MMARNPYPIPISPGQTRIGWIGIGVMGGAMASRLLSAGYSVTVFARDPSKSYPLRSQGAIVADSLLSLAASCDVVFTMLGHPPDVRQIVLEKLLSALSPGCVAVDCTSSSPALAREISSAARARGCWSVDAPVSGGDAGAREGRLAVLAGGDEGVVTWLAPVFGVLGQASRVGGPGCGQSCKIANQIAVGGSLLGLSEGLAFAGRVGLDRKRFLGAVRGGAAGSAVMELFGERMVDRDFGPGGFAEYMVKDLGMGVGFVGGGEGDERVVVLPGAAICKQLFSAMVANGDGKLGTHGLITVIDRLNGISE